MNSTTWRGFKKILILKIKDKLFFKKTLFTIFALVGVATKYVLGFRVGIEIDFGFDFELAFNWDFRIGFNRNLEHKKDLEFNFSSEIELLIGLEILNNDFEIVSIDLNILNTELEIINLELRFLELEEALRN